MYIIYTYYIGIGIICANTYTFMMYINDMCVYDVNLYYIFVYMCVYAWRTAEETSIYVLSVFLSCPGSRNR